MISFNSGVDCLDVCLQSAKSLFSASRWLQAVNSEALKDGGPLCLSSFKQLFFSQKFCFGIDLLAANVGFSWKSFVPL